MTDINELIDKVRKTVEAEISSVLDEAASKVEALEAGSAKAVEGEAANCRTLLEKGRVELAERMFADELSEKRKLLLAVKNRLLDLVFDKLRDKLARLEPSKYRKLFSGHLAATGALNGLKTVRAKTGRSETVLDASFFEAIENVNITLEGKSQTFERGFVLETDEFRIPVTLDDLVLSIREKTAAEVMNVHFRGLFGDAE